MIDKVFIGRAEEIDFPQAGLTSIPAKIDTGADVSCVWATDIQEDEQGLHFHLLGKSSKQYSGELIHVPHGEYGVSKVASSFGHREERYRVKLSVRIKGRLFKGTFTLADRQGKTYPVLLGRRLLAGKFLVDVKQGTPLPTLKKTKRALLKKDVNQKGLKEA